MQAPRLARDIYTNNNHVGVAGRLLRFFDTDDGAQPDAACTGRFRLSCLLRADRFVFMGGPQGEHSIAAEATITDARRLLAHWQGYCENTVRFYAGHEPPCGSMQAMNHRAIEGVRESEAARLERLEDD